MHFSWGARYLRFTEDAGALLSVNIHHNGIGGNAQMVYDYVSRAPQKRMNLRFSV
jgi:hypothetical protein